MAIFLIVPISNPTGVEQAITEQQKLGKLDFTKLPSSGFFVSFSGTSQELSNLVGISEGTSGTGVVVAVSSYFGRAPTNIWDWVKSRWSV